MNRPSSIPGREIVVVLTEQVSDAHLAGLRSENVSYIFAGKSELDLALALEILNRELAIKRLELNRPSRPLDVSKFRKPPRVGDQLSLL